MQYIVCTLQYKTDNSMKKKNLREGNFLIPVSIKPQHPKHLVAVGSLQTAGIVAAETGHLWGYNELTGIATTIDLLMANGWQKEDAGYNDFEHQFIFTHPKYKEVTLIMYEDFTFSMQCGSFYPSVTCVHELQNVFYFVCGMEIEFDVTLTYTPASS